MSNAATIETCTHSYVSAEYRQLLEQDFADPNWSKKILDRIHYRAKVNSFDRVSMKIQYEREAAYVCFIEEELKNS